MSNPQPQPRILGLRFFSLTEMVAEKADIKNSSEKSVRILSSFFWKSCLLFNKKTYIRFFVPDGFSDADLLGRDERDAEASKHDSSPYNRTAETRFGGRKSENIISSFEGIREDSDSIPQIRLY